MEVVNRFGIKAFKKQEKEETTGLFRSICELVQVSHKLSRVLCTRLSCGVYVTRPFSGTCSPWRLLWPLLSVRSLWDVQCCCTSTGVFLDTVVVHGCVCLLLSPPHQHHEQVPRLSVATGSALPWLCEGSAWSAVTDFTDICPHSETSCNMNYWRHTRADLCHDYAKQCALPPSALWRAVRTAALTLSDNLLPASQHRNFVGVWDTWAASVLAPCAELLMQSYCLEKSPSLQGFAKRGI